MVRFFFLVHEHGAFFDENILKNQNLALKSRRAFAATGLQRKPS